MRGGAGPALSPGAMDAQAHLATADRRAVPHVVPVCFAIRERTLYITIDEKPKRRPGTALKRLRNIAENPAVAVVVDRYDEDWTRLGWVMLRGHADILNEGTEHRAAQTLPTAGAFLCVPCYRSISSGSIGARSNGAERNSRRRIRTQARRHRGSSRTPDNRRRSPSSRTSDNHNHSHTLDNQRRSPSSRTSDNRNRSHTPDNHSRRPTTRSRHQLRLRQCRHRSSNPNTSPPQVSG